MGNNDRSINVDAHGNATAKYDRVMFTVSVESTEASLSGVKESLIKDAERFKQAFALISGRDGVDVEKGSLSTTSNIAREQEYDQKKRKTVKRGYAGVFTASFELTTPDAATDVYDQLTELEGFEVSAPQFRLKHQEALKKEALKDAFRRLTERFSEECSVVGKDPNAYELASWHVDYRHAPSPKSGLQTYASNAVAAGFALDVAGDDGQVDIQASLAIVTVYMTATFVPKA